MLRTPMQRQPTAPGGVRYLLSKGCVNLNSPASTPMDPTHLNDDFRDFLICLNEAGVEYLIVGGHAVAYYGYVRPTRDMDVWIAVSSENAEKLVHAVKAFFGVELKGLAKEWFLDSENVTRFGAVPNLIEIVPTISGGNFAEAYGRREVAEIDGQKANLISLHDLLANKKTSGRLKDLTDVEELTRP
jgi:hypothetical protein